jgi:ankyrin repeat protein
MLLAGNAEPNMAMRNGRTALIIGSEQGYPDVVLPLLKFGSNVHAVTISGKSALYSACENGHTAIVPMLLDFGSDPNLVGARLPERAVNPPPPHPSHSKCFAQDRACTHTHTL